MELTRRELIEDFKPYKAGMDWIYSQNTSKQLQRLIHELNASQKVIWDAEDEMRLEEAKLELINRN
jgi:hypothetical protein